MSAYLIQFDVEDDGLLNPNGSYAAGEGFEVSLRNADRYATRELAEEVNSHFFGGTVVEAPKSPRELFLEFLEDPPSSVVDIREEFISLFPEEYTLISPPRAYSSRKD